MAVHAIVTVVNIAGGAPQMTYFFGPKPGFVATPFAQTEHNGMSGLFQGFAHRCICALRVEMFGKTPVVFQIIDTPFGIHQCILIFVATASRATTTGFIACAGINSEFQTFRVYIIGKGFDARRKTFGVGDNKSERVAANLPAIVDDYVFVSSVFHSGSNHSISCFHNQFFAYIACKFIPTVPAHWRGHCKSFKFLRYRYHSD